MAGIDVEVRRGIAEEPPALATRAQQEKAREAVGERRLADAARSFDQPGMGEAAGADGLDHLRLRRLVAEKLGREPGMRMLFGLRLRAAFAGHSLAPRRSRTAATIAAWTRSTSALASTTTQRCGSALAMARKPSRRRSWNAVSIRSKR